MISQRISVLRELEKRLAEQFKKQFVGEIIEVLIENEVKKTGRAERYYEIAVLGQRPVPKGEIAKCRINDDAVSAELV